MKVINLVACFLLLPCCSLAQPDIAGLLSKLSHTTGDSQKIAAYTDIINYYSINNPDSQSWYATQGIEYAKKNNYKIGEAIIMAQLAVSDEYQGRVDLGKQRVEYALSIYREQHYMKGIAEMLQNLGAVEAGKGNYDVATTYLISALKVYDTIADPHGQVLAYMNLGNLYHLQADTANAWKYFRIAEAIAKKIPLSDATIFLYNIIGVLYAETGHPDKALPIFIHDLELSDKSEFVRSHVECLLYLGNLYSDKGDVREATKYLEQGMNAARQNNLPEMEANILVEMARIKEKNEPDSAIEYLNRARAICEQIQSKSFLVNVYDQIAAVYEHKGDFKQALVAVREKQKMLDSIYSINKAREIASLGATYELEKSNIRINELEAESKEDAKERNIIILIAAIAVGLLLVVLSMHRRTIILNKKLVVREQEMKELNATKDKLFSIIGHDLRGPIARIPILLDIYEDRETDGHEKKFIMASLREHTIASTETLDKLLYWGQSLLKGFLSRVEKIDPKKIISANIELKKVTAAEKQITINDITPAAIAVYGAPNHFDFIIRNLLDNAIKYSYPGGSIEISAEVNNSPGFTVFAIKDNGTGIDKSKLSRIFNPMNSTDGTANEKGTGIGLMLCKDFAVQNGGDLWVASEEGKGTTFYLSVKNSV